MWIYGEPDFRLTDSDSLSSAVVLRTRTRKHFDARNPKGTAASKFIPGDDQSREPGIGTQRCAILAVRDENLLSAKPRVDLSQRQHYLVAIRGRNLDILELTVAGR